MCKLSMSDKEILRMFFKINASWGDLLRSQILAANIKREHLSSSYFLDFDVDRTVSPLPMSTEMPVEILYGETIVLQEQIAGYIDRYPMIPLHQTSAASHRLYVIDDHAIGARLHFKGGYLNELEVYSISGNDINVNDIIKKPCIYLIHDETLLCAFCEMDNSL